MRIPFIAAAASVVTLLAACSSTPPMKAEAPAPAPVVAQTVAPAPSTNAVDQAKLEAERQAALVAQQRTELNAKSVYFDFDNYTVKPEYSDMLEKQATFLKTQPTDRLVLQGNSDERGGTEYNMALGQKRADAVRKALVLLGAPEDRIETVSFGKEKPKATCANESCWSQNRRTDFVHGTK